MSAWSPRWCPSRRSAALTLLATVLLLTVAPGRAAPPAAPDAGPAPYPADFDPFLALPTPPPWAAQATFSADAAALADRLATQDRVWARVDLRVPTPDLDRLTPAQRQAWQAALALDAAALAALRAAPQVAAVEALPPVVRAVADPPPLRSAAPMSIWSFSRRRSSAPPGAPPARPGPRSPASRRCSPLSTRARWSITGGMPWPGSACA